MRSTLPARLVARASEPAARPATATSKTTKTAAIRLVHCDSLRRDCVPQMIVTRARRLQSIAGGRYFPRPYRDRRPRRGDFAMQRRSTSATFDRARPRSVCCSAQRRCRNRPHRRKFVIEPDGTVHMPAQAVPVSGFLSPEGKAYLAEHLAQSAAARDARPRRRRAAAARGLHRAATRAVPRRPRRHDDRRRARLRLHAARAAIAAENRDRVLIDLHGGGFRECWPACAELESMPIAALGRIKVVSLDYRQGPEHRHPAASEDVAAAYRELLEDVSRPRTSASTAARPAAC